MLYTKKVLIISLIILLASCKSEPEVYLSNVMDIMKDNSINTKNIDWKSLKSSTLKKAEGKETIEEIYNRKNATAYGPCHLKFMPEETCPKCGYENITKAAWCEKCLHHFDDYGKEKSLKCPNCFHVNEYNDSHCEVCHEPLKPGQWE